MNEDKFGLVEKILKDINNVLTKTSELHSFEIIPVDTNWQNKSPVLFFENCLGIESWCVKHVYMHCYSELMDNCCAKSKQKRTASNNTDRIIKLLNVTILLNPEICIFWNKRREMICSSILDKYNELHFSRLVLSRTPKCNEAFMYRRWLLNLVLPGDNFPINNIEDIINDEVSLCDLASGKCTNNYHSWSHRLWFTNKLKCFQDFFDINSFFIREYMFSHKWTSCHISDHSCYHYHQNCIKDICSLPSNSWKTLENNLCLNLRKVFVKVITNNCSNDLKKLQKLQQSSEEDLIAYSEENLVKLLLGFTNKTCNCTFDYMLVCRKLEILFHELEISDNTIKFYINHETLWYHRRFILNEIIVIIFDYFGFTRHNAVLTKKTCKTCNFTDLRLKQAKILRYDCNHIYSSILFNVIVSYEKKFIEERRNCDDFYADKHKKYLKLIL